MFWSLQNMRKNGFIPKTIIDIGAYQGEWTREVLTIFPAANFLMIEAQDQKRAFMSRVTNDFSRQVDYHIGLLGAQDGLEVEFNEMETASSALKEHYSQEGRVIKKTTVALDTLLKEKQIGNVDFIKLDTQGYELEILKGGGNALKQAEVVLMEVSLLDIHQGVPLIREVLNFMGERSFQAYDICSFTRRPLDRALWQTDIIFVKNDSQLLSNKKYK